MSTHTEPDQDQWKRKKQTPEQKREAKKQKLDPDNWKSAKDVMDERAAAAKKRKRDEDGEASEIEGVEPEQPKVNGDVEEPNPKKQKTAGIDGHQTTQETEEERMIRKREARAAKRERKREQKMKAKEKSDRSKARKQAEKAAKTQNKAQKSSNGSQKSTRDSQPQSNGTKGEDEGDDNDDTEMAEEIDISQPALITQLAEGDSMSDVSASEQVEVFSPPQESGTSSTSSILQPAVAGTTAKKDQSMPDTINATPKERLANAIATFRTKRKADTDSAPKSRAELLEQRRRQEEKRKAEKKEQKRREREEAQRQQEAEIAARFSPGGSGSLLNSPRSPMSTPDVNEPNNFSFGRIAFEDGSAFDPNMQVDGEGEQSDQRKKKGPSDAATALAAALKKKNRISGLDEEKRSRIASQDMWLAAKKRAAGEKVKDDTSLLKKALKRQEGQKKKSEKEWTERKEGIDKSIAAKQKKRTENLAKRKEEKGSKKGKSKPRRPGFEGSFKGRTGGKKKGKA